jgi:hypothetical protein
MGQYEEDEIHAANIVYQLVERCGFAVDKVPGRPGGFDLNGSEQLP